MLKTHAFYRACILIALLAPSKLLAQEPSSKGWDYFLPAWKEAQGLPFDAWKLSDHKLEAWLADPAGRIEPEFRVPLELKERVLFWLKIHTQYNTAVRVIHDRNNPGLIYGIADFSRLFTPERSKARALTLAYRLERQILKELRKRLQEAAGLIHSQSLSPLERLELRGFISRAGALGKSESMELVTSIRSQTGQRDEFLAALSRSQHLLPYIEASFRTYDLPIALARIPFVESSFNPRAKSKVGAVGIFQFMPITARQMISADPNLWADPLRQTRAAARMLVIFRSLLPDWSTTVTAYNSGVGRLGKLSRRYRAKSIVPLLETKDPTGLGFAGKNFYAQFLSANIAEAYRYEIFSAPQPSAPVSNLEIAKRIGTPKSR